MGAGTHDKVSSNGTPKVKSIRRADEEKVDLELIESREQRFDSPREVILRWLGVQIDFVE